FFFQAEDGIRDYKVTGVQTCALRSKWPSLRRRRRLLSRSHRPCAWLLARGAPGHDAISICRARRTPEESRHPDSQRFRARRDGRSEERRVGKERRARGAAEREKKEE